MRTIFQNTNGWIPGLKGTLRPFQEEGVDFLNEMDGRALIGDEMGLGKTIQALAYMQLHPEKRPAVIVCPASLKVNWLRETLAWMNVPESLVMILNGKPNGMDFHADPEIYIVNYDILANKRETKPDGNKVQIKNTGWTDVLLDKVKPKIVILDEAHYIKNRKAFRTKAIQKLCKRVPSVIALTGTPVINRPIELFNIIQIINPDLFPSFFNFAMRYCDANHNGHGWDFNGCSNARELHLKLTGQIMLRRLKKDVLQDLPPKQRSVVTFSLDNQKVYTRAERDFINWLRTQDPDKAKAAEAALTLVKIEHLKQLTIQGKIKACIEWIENFLDSGRKLVVFATHRNTVEMLMDHFGSQAVRLDGSTTQKNRQIAVDRFQTNDSVRLFVGNLKAAGVGLTLTSASDTCFLELGWTPGEHDQGEDRVHRIGQTDNVTAWYLLANGTIESEIADLLDQKRQVIGQVVDGTDSVEGSLLGDLVDRYR